MTHTKSLLSWISLVAPLAAACTTVNPNAAPAPSAYCDASGCFGCDPRGGCWPLDHAACVSSADCRAGDACTSIGCCAPCELDAQCPAAEACAEGFCVPVGVPAQPVDDGPAAPRACGEERALCVSDAACGVGRACDGGRCRERCDAVAACPTGTGCDGGLCRPVAPASTECGRDRDCAAGARCVDARCVPECADDSGCAGGTVCDRGLCRQDVYPAR